LAGLVGTAAPAGAAAVYVSAEGTDGAACRSKTAPCRSISRGIDVAGAGDTVVVGPGVYGDANRDVALDDPGDEVSAPACFCAIEVGKSVSIVSEGGAAATIVDAAGLADAVFRADAGGVDVGRRNGGFTITGGQEVGIVVSIGSTGTIGGGVTSTDDVAAGNGTGLALFGASTLTRVSVLNNTANGIFVDDGHAKKPAKLKLKPQR
jgi:hypothetical protein